MAPEIGAAVEAVLVGGEVAGGVPGAEGAAGGGDRRLDVAEDGVGPGEGRLGPAWGRRPS
jgi:hypothetical protein